MAKPRADRCEVKHRYSSKKQAAIAAAAARRKTGEDINHYHCDIHHAWHIGHRPGSRAELLPLIDENFAVPPGVYIQVVPPIEYLAVLRPHTDFLLIKLIKLIKRTKSKAHRRQLRAKFKRLLVLDNQIKFKFIKRLQYGQEKD